LRADSRGAGAGGRWTAVGAGSYLFWGFLPLLFAALAPDGPVEIVARRVVWTAVSVLAVLAASGRARELLAIARDRRALAGVALSAALLGVNWGAHVAGILSGQVVDAGVGYLVNPLLSVALAVVVLRERLGRAQWAAIGLACAGVAVIGFGYGRFPWVAVLLPVSWSVYGLVKKLLPAPGGVLAAFTAEMLVLVPWAGVLLAVTSAGLFSPGGPGRVALTLATGVATAAPLLAFNAAARRVRLSTLGMLQYLSAGCQVVLGVTLFAEPMPWTRLVGLLLVLVGVVVFAAASRRPRPAGPGDAAAPPPGAEREEKACQART
jgi:chloramphenicol-sensitive protein RarD